MESRRCLCSHWNEAQIEPRPQVKLPPTTSCASHADQCRLRPVLCSHKEAARLTAYAISSPGCSGLPRVCASGTSHGAWSYHSAPFGCGHAHSTPTAERSAGDSAGPSRVRSGKTAPLSCPWHHHVRLPGCGSSRSP